MHKILFRLMNPIFNAKIKSELLVSIEVSIATCIANLALTLNEQCNLEKSNLMQIVTRHLTHESMVVRSLAFMSCCSNASAEDDNALLFEKWQRPVRIANMILKSGEEIPTLNILKSFLFITQNDVCFLFYFLSFISNHL